MSKDTVLELHTLEDLFIKQLQDLYDTENQLLVALPKMAGAAAEMQLQEAFHEHLEETREHAQRLQAALAELGKEANRTCCEAMKGLIRESEMIIDANGDSAVRDAALITAAQRIEHYEMAGYGTARSIADQLGYTEIAHTLQLTLEEEKKADRQLTKIAESWINVQAARV